MILKKYGNNNGGEVVMKKVKGRRERLEVVVVLEKVGGRGEIESDKGLKERLI